MHLLGCFPLKHAEEQVAQPDANPESTKSKVEFCSFVDPHSLNQAGCRRIAEDNNVGLMLVEVKGLDADVVFDLCDELLEVDGVCDG